MGRLNSYFDARENLMKQLIEKTLEKGRQITFDEANGWYYEGTFPNPNDYAFYWTEFREAAKIALQQLKSEENRKPSNPKEEVADMSRKKIKPLDAARKEFVLSELTEMYIRKGYAMPTTRDIKKNAYISEEEVDTLRRTNEYTEHIIRKRAGEIATQVKQEAIIVEVQKMKETEPAVKVQKAEESNEKEVHKMEEQKIIENSNEQKPEEKYGYKKHSRLTSEQYTAMIRAACEEAGHILTQTEVNSAAAMGELPCWNTLQRTVGPWHEWGKKFGLPFKNEIAERMAKSLAEQADAEVLATEPAKQTDSAPVTENSNDTVSDKPQDTANWAKLLAMIANIPGVKIEGSITITFES